MYRSNEGCDPTTRDTTRWRRTMCQRRNLPDQVRLRDRSCWRCWLRHRRTMQWRMSVPSKCFQAEAASQFQRSSGLPAGTSRHFLATKRASRVRGVAMSRRRRGHAVDPRPKRRTVHHQIHYVAIERPCSCWWKLPLLPLIESRMCQQGACVPVHYLHRMCRTCEAPRSSQRGRPPHHRVGAQGS